MRCLLLNRPVAVLCCRLRVGVIDDGPEPETLVELGRGLVSQHLKLSMNHLFLLSHDTGRESSMMVEYLILKEVLGD